jgi:type II secretory ATPase GspE/PulE/Tfp pilus assembly ATPase PilB-like protein
MSDLSDPPLALVPLPATGSWRWPTPPYAGYAEVGPTLEGAACEIEGLTSAALQATLLDFDLDGDRLRVRVQITGTEMDLRFAQMRRLTLLAPLVPQGPAAGDPHRGLLAHRPVSDYRLRLAGGAGTLSGRSIGHVESAEGLFLFPPQGDDGTVLRMFVPRSTYAHLDIGPRIGELLVAQAAATPEQVEAAAAEQSHLRTRKLGELLVAERIVEPAQLMAAIDQQAKMPVVRIGEALVALKLITDEQLAQALVKQKADRSVPLGELLVKAGHVSREDLQLALARKMGYPVVDADAFPVEAEAVRALPFMVSRRMQVLPLLLRGTQLVVAMADPSRRADLEELEFITQMKIVPTLAQGAALALAIAATYQRFGANPWAGRDAVRHDEAPPIEFVPADANKLVESLELQHSQREAEEEKSIEQSDNSLVRLVNTAIIEAHAQGISDIHVETMPGREKVRIRFRKDGVLRPYLELPHTYRAAIVARIKIMCDLDISERRKPQDGKINFAKFSPQHRVELRVATIPTNGGLEDVVMRLLSSARAIAMEDLGLSDGNYKRLQMAIERPYGMVLCVGPTGSGKTTTLHSALGHINTPVRKIWTAEDPVEITQAGLRQVQVNPKIDWTFAKALRAFLRADPDVIMVGEIRDSETAQTAIEASLTGHLVLSTLHTNSAPDTVTRLLDMGMDPFNFGDSLLAVLAQRLVRRLCPHCRVPRDAGSDEIDELLLDWLHAFPDGMAPTVEETQQLWRSRYAPDGRFIAWTAPGCPECENTGFKGRVALHELMSVTKPLRRLIQTGTRAEELQRQAMADGMRTLRQDGIEKVLAGVTSIAEVRAMANA